MKSRHPLAAALLVLLLSCSGGGSSEPPPPQPPPIPPGVPFTLSGKISYDFVPAVYDPGAHAGTLDFARASVRPVRNARLQVRQASDNILAETTTDDSGNYAITFTPGPSGALQVVALAQTVTPSIRVGDNTSGDAVWAVGVPIVDARPTLNGHATHGWTGTSYGPGRIAAPFAILDSMYTASRRFMDVRPAVSFPALKVHWSPNNFPSGGFYDPSTGAIRTSHYLPSQNEIYILGKDGVDTDEFDSHVIVHEWGHFFEDNLSRADSPGGDHSVGDVLDPRLAFGEGYGNAIAAMLLSDSIYADTLWFPPGGTTIVAFGFDAENVPSPTDDLDASGSGMNPGPFSEMSVLRVLYDLYDDSGTNESWDTIAVGLGPIYDTLVGPEKSTDAFTTLASFVAGLKAQPGISGDGAKLAAIDAVLANRSIGPISDEWGTGDPNLHGPAGIYRDVGPLPFDDSVTLDGGFAENMRQSVQYWVVTGNGAQLTVSSFSTSDVGLEALRNGSTGSVTVGVADQFLGNRTETMRFTTVNGARYVIVLTGFERNQGSYAASLSVTSP